MNRKNKCNCTANHKVMCHKCSRIRMVMLLKKGNTSLKYKSDKGYVNPVWYSFLSKNSKPETKIINSMEERFKNSIYHGVTNKLMFYNNATRKLIKSIEY